KPVRAIESLVMEGKLNHEGNPVLKWMASNVVLDIRSDESMKFNKIKSIDKIDGMVALAMAIGAEMSAEPEDEGNFYVL
ncbi:MAG: terminase TerL endonuclease subunit, partial [Nitrosomonadaceae bacterium]